MSIRSFVMMTGLGLAGLAGGCAASSSDGADSADEHLTGASDADPMRVLLTCEDAATKTKAQLSVPTAAGGSKITLMVSPLDGFYTIEYRGSDVGAVSKLAAGRPVDVPAELLIQPDRRDMIHVSTNGGATMLSVEGDATLHFRCQTGGTAPNDLVPDIANSAVDAPADTPVSLLASCEDPVTKTKVDLSIETDPGGSLILMKVHPLDGFYALEYRGSDVGAVRQLAAGKSVTVPAEFLNEPVRRELIHLDVADGTTTLSLESAQHGTRTFPCTGD